MDSFMLSGFDIGIALSLLIFVVVGLMRGFTNDFLGLFTWFGAILSTTFFYPYLQGFARQVIGIRIKECGGSKSPRHGIGRS